jgi:DNA-binding response OmpR family regulator
LTEKPRLAARKHSERPHVLIVSDDPSLAQFLNEGLPLGGFWTTVIASGLQALEVFRLRQFDIIAVDWELRSFNAMELIRRLRGLSSRSLAGDARTHAPIVLISEHPVDLDPGEVLRLEIGRVLHAPLELDDLVPELHTMYEEWRERYPAVPLSDSPLREKL